MSKVDMLNKLLNKTYGKYFKTGIFVLSVFSSQAGFALSSDKDETLHVEAGKVTMNEKDGTSHYTGKVKITQGSRLIKGDVISVYSKDSKITRVVIKGKPALFSQLNEEKNKTQASANTMVYYMNQDLLVMEHNAILQQKDNIFRSEKISYNTAKDIITAGTPNASDKERVKITIHPEKDKDKQIPQ